LVGERADSRIGTGAAVSVAKVPFRNLAAPVPETEMGAGIAASPHCAERRICRCS